MIDVDWDERGYLAANPDVRAAIEAGEIASGQAHYMAFGKTEGRPLAVASTPVGWHEWAYLCANPDVAAAVASGQIESGFEHYRSCGEKEGRKPAGYADSVEFCKAQGMPSWLSDQLLEASYLEPQLSPRLETLSGLRQISFLDQGDRFVDCYKRAILSLQADYTHIFLLPWIRRGGSDLELINIINFVSSQKKSRVGVILSEPVVSDWAIKLSSNVDIFDLGNDESQLSLDEKTHLMLRFLFVKKPKILHVSNCTVGWNLLTQQGAALRSEMHLFVSLFCYDYGSDGRPIGYARTIGKAAPYLSGVLVDNATYGRHLVDYYGVPANIVTSIRFPIEASERYNIADHPYNRVLWASRLDRQKRPELAVAIAGKLPDMTIEMFGNALLEDGGSVIDLLASTPNIQWGGGYSNFDTLPKFPYVCFLYTSAWDGLPNVVLEAMASGLPVVSSNIGGISEILDNDVGYLIDDHTNPDAYAAAIQSIVREPEIARRKRDAAVRRVNEMHSRSGFNRTILSIQNYWGR